MALNISDLQPKEFEIKIKGQTTMCKPPKLSHVFILSKLGNIFKNANEHTVDDINTAEKDLEFVFGELIPELKGVSLDMQTNVDIITQVMEHIAPDETKELKEQGVQFGTDPKAERTG